MAEFKWYGGDDAVEVKPANSGTYDTIGFFGAGGFGYSVPVGEYQDNTYSTNDTGTSESGALPNIKYLDANNCYVGNESSGTALEDVRPFEATLHIEFSHTSAVQTQNTRFIAFDRNSINNNPSGVTVYAAEIKDPVGSGDTAWTQIAGSGSVLSLDNQTNSSTTHDFYVALSASPNSFGEKSDLAFYIETEYL